MPTVPAKMFSFGTHSLSGPYGTLRIIAGGNSDYSSPYFYPIPADSTIIHTNGYSDVGPVTTDPDATVVGYPTSFSPSPVDVEVTYDVNSGGISFFVNWSSTVQNVGQIFTPTLIHDYGNPLHTRITRDGKEYTFKFAGTAGGCMSAIDFVSGGYVFGFEYFDTHLEIEWDGTTETTGVVNTNLALNATVTHTFLNENNPIRVRAVDSYGQASAWVTLKIPPVASIVVANNDDPLFDTDFSESFDIDGTIVSYTPHPGNPPGGDVPQSGTTYQFDLTEIEVELEEDTPQVLSVTVTDNDGLTGYAETTVTLEPDVGGQTSSPDPHGRIFSAGKYAAPPSENIRIFYDVSDNSAIEDQPALSGRTAALYLVNARLWRMVNDGSGYGFEYSDDGGANFTAGSITMFSGYKGAAACGLDAGHAACAIDPDTMTVYSRTSYDAGAGEWDPEVEVGVLPGGAARRLNMYQLNAAGNARLIIFHPPTGLRWYSDAFGAAGSWVAAVI